ncbi:hypothetical protein [Magnetospirillum fulvum]|uniref:Uncharacterized protein n=1 Tax=Magnetospirillum fulvum MGU-K5 TaxID=1316936 RepID=S9S9B3_MAGFU|nr:hypothetical protein [Magnetospirillum fulvum]EPY00618.1 hypothetical protein K678_15224 [Magnetospirillum fulvum MGU-K5]
MTSRVTLPRGERDTTPELRRLAAEGRLPWHVADVLYRERVRTAGCAARMGRRWLRLVPGLGPIGLARLEAVLHDLDLSLAT